MPMVSRTHCLRLIATVHCSNLDVYFAAIDDIRVFPSNAFYVPEAAGGCNRMLKLSGEAKRSRRRGASSHRPPSSKLRRSIVIPSLLSDVGVQGQEPPPQGDRRSHRHQPRIVKIRPSCLGKFGMATPDVCADRGFPSAQRSQMLKALGSREHIQR